MAPRLRENLALHRVDVACPSSGPYSLTCEQGGHQPGGSKVWVLRDPQGTGHQMTLRGIPSRAVQVLLSSFGGF